jgi:hypothetical protein
MPAKASNLPTPSNPQSATVPGSTQLRCGDILYRAELIPGELQRSQTLELFEGVFLPVVSRTDAAISKLIWIDKGSQRSRQDFRSIFSGCDQQQQLQIREQAAGLQLSNLLDEAMTEADEIR